MKNNIPEKIRVKIERDSEGYYATLVDYDVFTEADSLPELFDMINDLIFCTFEIAEVERKNMIFVPQLSRLTHVKLFLLKLLLKIINKSDSEKLTAVQENNYVRLAM